MVKTRQLSHFSRYFPCRHNSTATAVGKHNSSRYSYWYNSWSWKLRWESRLSRLPPAPAELMTCSSSDARYSLRLVRLACGCVKGPTLIDCPECTNWNWTFFIGVLVRGEISESSPKTKIEKNDVPCHSTIGRQATSVCLADVDRCEVGMLVYLVVFGLPSCSNQWRTQFKKQKPYNDPSAEDMTPKAHLSLIYLYRVMDQFICASLSHAHYWYEVGMLKVPAL